jgi:hypothetical protein
MGAKMGSMEGELAAASKYPSSDQNSTSTVICETLNEIAERHHRENNLILRGVPESDSSDLTGKTLIDKRVVVEILNEIDTTFTQDEIVRVQRLGRKEENRTRPVKVIFRESSAPKNVLVHKFKLKGSVRIYPDLTPMQMSQYRELRNELDARIKGGETNIALKFIAGTYKIVKGFPKNQTLN